MTLLRFVKKGAAPVLLFSAACLSLSFTAPGRAVAHEFKVDKVYDGDTIRVEGYGTEINVRLAGIDAPELCTENRDLGQPFCEDAQAFLSKQILGKVVEVKGYGHRNFNLMWGVIYLGDRNLNLEMVREGFAEVYRGKSPEGFDLEPFFAAEKEAAQAKKGIWSLEGEYVSPREWRKTVKAKSACAILLYGLCDEKGQ